MNYISRDASLQHTGVKFNIHKKTGHPCWDTPSSCLNVFTAAFSSGYSSPSGNSSGTTRPAPTSIRPWSVILSAGLTGSEWVLIDIIGL